MFTIAPVSPSPEFPKQADAVVIGAGIIGISTAIELQERGLKVVVLEKGEVAAEQSSRNWGWCRQMGRDPREIPLIKVAMNLWRGMNARIGAETGYRTCGVVYLSGSEDEQAGYATWQKDHGQMHGLSTRLLSSADVATLVPGSSRPWVGGMFTDDDGRAEPFVAAPAMAEFFKSRGGLLFTRCAARGVETAAGKICAVVSERGAIATPRVVVAGGYWSERFLGNLGVRFPQTGVVSSVMRTSAVDLGHERTFAGGAFAARKRRDGGYTVAHNRFSVADLTPRHLRYFADFLPILKLNWRDVKLRCGKRFFDEWKLARRWSLDAVSPFEQVRVLDVAPYDHLLDEALSELQKAYPAFFGAKVEQRWAGMIDTTPDAVPVIDKIDQVPGLFLASGFSGHGFGLGPGAGQLMAEIMLGEKTCVDPAPFRLSRFSDGAGARPITGV
jgi:glycine/D-amino acid oxidase-like deaminating enzyme